MLKTVDPSDLPSTLRQVIGGTVFSTVAPPKIPLERRQGRRAHGAGDRDPHRAREREVERRDREGALGHAADRKVPPDERLPKARGEEPGRRGPPGLPARPDPAPARRRLSAAAPPVSDFEPDSHAATDRVSARAAIRSRRSAPSATRPWRARRGSPHRRSWSGRTRRPACRSRTRALPRGRSRTARAPTRRATGRYRRSR